MQTPRAPSGPPVYEVPLNPIDAATAALVDYEAERRRAEQEEAKLVKGYMVGGGNSGWIDKAKKTPGGEGVINSGFRFSTTPQNAAGIPSRSSSVASFNSSARAQRTQDFLNHGCNKGAAHRTETPRESRRCRLRKLQCMLRQTAAEGFRLLCGEKKHQLTGQAEAEMRSFFSGATAAAAAAASGKGCNTDALRAPVTNNTSVDASAGIAASGGVSVEHAAGQDTSTHLLRSLAQGCQILAQELDQHIRRSGLQPFLFGKTFVSMWMKRRAGVPWRRTATSMKQKERRKKRQYEFAKPPTGKLHFAHAVVGGKTSRFAGAAGGEADEPKHAHLLLKEELRRKVYEQMEARAATVQAQQVNEEASAMWVPTDGGGTVTQMRVFKKGFDSEPPSSHGSYQTASECESSDSVPTEAYVSPSSSARSSSRGSNSSRLSSERASVEEFMNDVTSDESAAPLGRYGSTTTFETLCGKENTPSDASSERKRSNHTSASRNINELRERRIKGAKFQWLAGYSAEEQEREATVMRQQQKSHVALAINSGKRQPLQQQVEAGGRLHQLEGKPLVRSTLPVQRRGQRKSEGGSVESVDLEALRAQSFTSERGTLDSLPESDLCEPLPSSHQDRQKAFGVSSVSTLKRRVLRNRDNCVSRRASSSCESITALAESSVPATKSAPPDYIEVLSKASEERVTALAEATSSAERREAEPQVACMDNETKTCHYMAEGGSWTGVSIRMKEAYASCLHKARRSFLPGNFHSATTSAVASGRTENPPGAVAAALKGPAAPHAGRLHAPRDVIVPCFATSRSKDSKSSSHVSHVTYTDPTPRMLLAFALFSAGTSSLRNGASAVSPPAIPVNRIPSQNLVKEGHCVRESATRVGKRREKAVKFETDEEHGMMLDIDYDQVQRNWNSSENTVSGPPVSCR